MPVPKHPYRNIYVLMVIIVANIGVGILNLSLDSVGWAAVNLGVAAFVAVLTGVTFHLTRKHLANIEQFNLELERFNQSYFS
jgi:hypothetical protein